MLPQEDVEFKTIDGIFLRGCLYPVAGTGPGIILSPGVSALPRNKHSIKRSGLIIAQFNCVKEMLGLPEAAMYFQQSGITSLIYDPRSTGLSDGSPRNDIDPIKQVEDFSDAVTFLSNHPNVKPDQILLWGMSFGGAVSLYAASLDKRVKLVVAICPTAEILYTPEKLPKVLMKCMQDRESQLKGNAPFYMPVLAEDGVNPAGFGIGVDKERFAKIVGARREVAPNHVNRTTIQSYYKMVMWQPSAVWKHLGSTPVMFVVPELDRLCPPEIQLRYFETIAGPKRSHLALGRGHMDILENEDFPSIMEVQSNFIHDVLEGKLRKEEENN